MRRRAGGFALMLTLISVLAFLAAAWVAGCGESGTPADGKPVTSTTGGQSATTVTSGAAEGMATSVPSSSSTSLAGSDSGAVIEIPPTPSDVSGMRDWLAKAYPDAAWLGRIKAIEHVPDEVPDSGGFSNAVVVTTDLDFASEMALGQEIAAALGEAHVGWAKQYVIWFSDGANMMAGDIVDMTP
jgi:hypothetical protein